MPATGRPYRNNRSLFREECKARREQCAICRGTRGPIHYYAKAEDNDPLAFTVDHIVPTSLGGHPHATTNMRAAHASCNASRGDGTRGQFPTSRRW